MLRRTLSALTVAVVAAAWSAPAVADDLVLLANGGRMRGTVVEHDPTRGTTVRLADGSFRYLSPAEVSRCEFDIRPAAAAPVPQEGGAPAATPEVTAGATNAAVGGAEALPAAPALVPPVVEAPPLVEDHGPAPTPSAAPTASASPPAPVQMLPAPSPAVWVHGQPVPPRMGFQLAVRLGTAAPHGRASQDMGSLRQYAQTQVMIQVDLGWKTSPQWFFGGYVSVGSGAVGEQVRGGCDTFHVGCRSSQARLGLSTQYQFRPAWRVNPWVEYSIGIEAAVYNDVEVAGSRHFTRVQTLSGLEWGQLGAGVDWRLRPSLGLGVYVRESLGTYGSFKREGGTTDTATEKIAGDRQSVHGWFMIGVRGIIYP